MEGNRNSHPRRLRYVADDVVHWRSQVLRHAGCDAALARDLAADADIDLHELLGLIDRGCPPHLAARILAPLDRG
jgi:hypothetical protein